MHRILKFTLFNFLLFIIRVSQGFYEQGLRDSAMRDAKNEKPPEKEEKRGAQKNFIS